MIRGGTGTKRKTLDKNVKMKTPENQRTNDPRLMTRARWIIRPPRLTPNFTLSRGPHHRRRRALNLPLMNGLISPAHVDLGIIFQSKRRGDLIIKTGERYLRLGCGWRLAGGGRRMGQGRMGGLMMITWENRVGIGESECKVMYQHQIKWNEGIGRIWIWIWLDV